MKKEFKNLSNHEKWNFKMGVLHGSFFNAGMAFADIHTLIPVFLSFFSDSNILIGMFISLYGINGVIPQLFVANKLETKIHKKPLLIFATTVRAFSFALLAVITFFFAESNPFFMLISLFIILNIFSFMGGIAVIPLMDIFGKTISSKIRGRFFGHRQFWGGLLAIGAGSIAKIILDSELFPFPTNYSIMFFLAFIFMGISYIALGSMRETTEEVHRNVLSFSQFMQKSLKILKSNKNYRKFIIIQILIGANTLALPFYIIYAKDYLTISLGMVGVFVSAKMFGRSVSNLIWAYVSDFMGNKKLFQISLLIGMSVPALAIFTPANMPILFILLFTLSGVCISGVRLGVNSFLLDIAPSKDRLAYVSLNSSLTFITMIFPLLGGILLNFFSYKILFSITLVLIFLAFLIAFTIEESEKK